MTPNMDYEYIRNHKRSVHFEFFNRAMDSCMISPAPSDLRRAARGSRELGLRSLPVQFGVDTAKWLTVATIDVTQLSVAAYL